jgi:hypothetical protein
MRSGLALVDAPIYGVRSFLYNLLSLESGSVGQPEYLLRRTHC